ncbi:MAG: DUF4037 domain-containing protein [Caldilineaceae bacterium]
MVYDIQTDSVLHALIAEAITDPDVIGLVLMGSRSIGGVASDSDYDVIFVVTDKALNRYQQTQTTPPRGATITPPINTNDISHESPSTLQLEKVVRWMLPAWAEAQVLYDRTGETTRVVDALRRMPEVQAHSEIAAWYDAYLNGLYRSLKAWRRGNELGARLEAAQTADYLIYLLFALEHHWRPYSSRLIFHLDKLEGQGWQSSELHNILLNLITTGDPRRQQALATRVATLLRERGYGYVYDAWEGKIDQALSWRFI